MKKELNINEFIEKIKEDPNNVEKFINENDESLILKNIDENFTINPRDKTKLIKFLDEYKNDESRSPIISAFIAGLFTSKEVNKLLSKDDVFSQLNPISKTFLVAKTDSPEKFLTKERKDEIEPEFLIDLIGAQAKDFTIEQLIDLEFENSYLFIEKLKQSKENVGQYLTAEKVKELGLNSYSIRELIKITDNIEMYLTPEKIQELGLDKYSVIQLIKENGNIDKYLTPQKVQELGLNENDIENLVKSNTNTIDKYLTSEKIQELGLNEYTIAELIKATGNIDKYLSSEKIQELGLNEYTIAELIKNTGDVDKYLTRENIEKLNLDSDNIVRLIESTGDIDKYLTRDNIEKLNLDPNYVVRLIESTGDIDKYLTKENIEKLNLKPDNVVRLIESTGDIDKYLSREDIEELKLNHSYISELIKKTENKEKYLSFENVKKYKLKAEDILQIIGTTYDENLENMIDDEIQNGEYEINKIRSVINIQGKLETSNSAKLDRLKITIAKQLYKFPEEEQNKKITELKKIFETSDLPLFAQNYLVFEEMHKNLLEDVENNINDESILNIPTLSQANKTERKHIIVSDLLRATIESNNLEIKEYIKDIENGNNLYLKLKNNEIEFSQMSKAEQQSIKKYSNILNALYNQTSKGRRQPEPRKNSGDVIKDLKQLEDLFQDSNINTNNLPDRIVRMFGYWIGIRNFEQAKETVNNIAEKITEKNKNLAQNGNIELQEGDFAKGINMRYFSDILQNGILAKDYLGESSFHDYTPGDTDTILITKENKNYDKLRSEVLCYRRFGNYRKR